MELSQDLTLLNRLWKAAERTALLDPSHSADNVFLPIGLRLDLLSNPGYYCTPVNVSSFASTGGDGVHFSLVHLDDKPTDQSPVVMTVPLGIVENVIVGSNLTEFLALGCVTGYFALEKLGYDRNDYLAGNVVNYRKIYTSDHGWPTSTDGEDAVLLRFLIDEFSLSPWNNVEERLDQLRDQYLPLLRFASDYSPDEP